MSIGTHVFVSVGTDYHSFDRLIDWMDRWYAEQDAEISCFVQHGQSRAPARCDGSAFLSNELLHEQIAKAAVVVCHGGPATIAETRSAGKLPICVPRDPERGEHVDGHQQRFARRVARDGVVLLAEDESALRSALQRAVEQPASVLIDEGGAGLRTGQRAAVARAGALITELLAGRRGSRATSGD